MIEPSSIRRPEGYKPRIVEVEPGFYRIENAYEGEYVYFENDNFHKDNDETGEEKTKEPS